MSEKGLAIRLCMRVEGDFWVAYVAPPNTMDGAFCAGSISIVYIAHNAERREAFLDMMRDALSETIPEMRGKTLYWNDPVSAPEHEKAGRA